jgi:hypothetical protein
MATVRSTHLVENSKPPTTEPASEEDFPIYLKLRIQKIDPVVVKPEDKSSGHWFERTHIVVDSYSTNDHDPGALLFSPDC